jgi:hypothetical protein
MAILTGEGGGPAIEPLEARAERHKRAVGEALGGVIGAMRAARTDGFEVQFQVGLDAFGQVAVTQPVSLVKRY